MVQSHQKSLLLVGYQRRKMHWPELVKIALIGTNRATLSPEVRKALAVLKIKPEQDTASLVLEGASVWSLMQKVGNAPSQWPYPLPTPAVEEETSSCSPRSARHLHLILDGTYEEALEEFLQIMHLKQKRLPPESLPELFDRCLIDSPLWDKISPAIGARGGWLLAQNPEWLPLNCQPNPENWETAKRVERKQILEALRANQPTQAIELIISTWKEDDLNSRVQFIKTLKINLSEEDEDFLEEKLDDSRKEIRKIAAELLGQLPDSALNQRMFQRLQPYLQLKKKKSGRRKLEVQLPEQSDNSMIRDGIDPSAQWYKGGVKASRLGQMIASIPPRRWNEHFQTSTSETLQLIVRSDWSELILQAVAEASATHQDEEWMEYILDFWLEHYHQQRWNYFNLKKLLESISVSTFNKICTQNVQKTNSLLDEESPLTTILRTVKLPWDDTLSVLVIRAMQKWIAGETAHYWSGWHLRSILKQAAYLCNPELLEQLARGWPYTNYGSSNWEKEIDNFLSTLKFRQEMKKALEQ